MKDAIQAVSIGLLAGVVLGAIFFGGLMLSVRRLPSVRRPMAFAFGSFVVRSAVVVAGLAWIAQNDWRRLASALIGLIAMRSLLVHFWGPPRTVGDPKESGDPWK